MPWKLFVPDLVTTLTIRPDARPYSAVKLLDSTENSCTESNGTCWPIPLVNSSLLLAPSRRMLVELSRWPLMEKPAPRSYEVAGVPDPPRNDLAVVLSNSGASFLVRTITDSHGRFVFRRVAPGAYSIWVSVPNQGKVLRTVDVGPSFSAPDGPVTVTIALSVADPATALAASRNLVSVRELKVPDSARKEYAEALKLLGSNDPDGAARRLRRAVSSALQPQSRGRGTGGLPRAAPRFGGSRQRPTGARAAPLK